MVKNPYISICIPTHEMKGYDAFLRQSFDIFKQQTFNNFEVIISDNSKGHGIENICKEYSSELNIKYARLKPSPGIFNQPINMNNALRMASGKLIKILYMDDFLYGETSLQVIVENFDLNKDWWLATACLHTTDGITYSNEHQPSYNDEIHLGNNTIGSPSVITIKNENLILFDEKMAWAVDADYYKMCYRKFGSPKLINTVCSVIRCHPDQQSNTVCTKEVRGREFLYTTKKWGHTDLYNQHKKYWSLRSRLINHVRNLKTKIIQKISR